MDPKLTSEYFENLYTKKDGEKVVKLEDAPGITIIKPYPAKYSDRQDYSMFIRFYILDDGFVHGGINMIESSTGYVREDQGQFKESFTNFSLETTDKITFHPDSQRFIIKRWCIKHKFTANEFVSLFIKNHLRKKPLFPKIKEKIKIYFLILIFWLLNDNYDWGNYYDYMKNKQQNFTSISSGNLDDKKIKRTEDPFFKYFYIHKNMLSVFMVLVFLLILGGYIFFSICEKKDNGLSKLFSSEYFGIDNPIYFFGFFVFLFLLEILSLHLENDFNNRKGFIFKIHRSIFYNSFKLRIF